MSNYPQKSIKRHVFLFIIFALFTSYTTIYSNNLSTIYELGPITSISPTTGYSGTVVTISDTRAKFSLADKDKIRLFPIITIQPIANQTVCVGKPIQLNVTANSSDPSGVLSYAWSLNGNPLSDGGAISGSQTNVLNITSATAANAGNYTCLITDSFDGITTSATATVTISNPTISINPPAKTTVCELEPVTLTTTSSAGTVSWNNGINEGISCYV